MPSAISVGQPPVEVRLRRDPRARRLVLRLGHAGGTPVLTLPSELPLTQARAFLEEQAGWLRSRIAASPARLAAVDGATLPLGDGSLRIRAVGRGRLRHAGGVLEVPGPAAMVPVKVAAFLRETARAACAAGVARHAPAVGRNAGRITLRDPRGRWGSCTSTGDLMFSWRLALAPASVLDYVVAHEIAHLREMNHGPRFWALVERLRPDHAADRAWLRQNGPALHRWDFRAVVEAPG